MKSQLPKSLLFKGKIGGASETTDISLRRYDCILEDDGNSNFIQEPETFKALIASKHVSHGSMKAVYKVRIAVLCWYILLWMFYQLYHRVPGQPLQIYAAKRFFRLQDTPVTSESDITTAPFSSEEHKDPILSELRRLVIGGHALADFFAEAENRGVSVDTGMTLLYLLDLTELKHFQ